MINDNLPASNIIAIPTGCVRESKEHITVVEFSSALMVTLSSEVKYVSFIISTLLATMASLLQSLEIPPG